MADPRSFHDKAVPFIPGPELKANSCWVAVLKTEHKPTDDDLNVESYLWVKVASRFTGEIIRDQYQKKFNPPEAWILKHEFQLLDLKRPLFDLDVYDDRLIVLEAVPSSDSERHATRRPLEPIKTQLLQQPQVDKVTPMLHPLKSPSSGTYNRQDENSISSSPNPFGSCGSTATPQQAPSRPFNPTVNSFERQRLNSTQSPVNVTAPVIPSSPASASHTGHSPGYLLFKFTYFRFANDQQAWAAWSTIPPNDRPIWERHAQQPGLTGALPAAPQAHNPPAVKSEFPSNSPTIKSEPVRKPANFSESSITEPPLSAEELKELNEQKEQSFQLQNLLKEASPKTLETSVEQGVKILDRIKAPLLGEGVAKSPDAEQWIQQIDALRKQAIKTKTIIGVVGNTGAGKSSVINAMLDEERLVPTNCMRACTAVVTEISYNHEEEPYRAQIEFIKLEDWEKELKVLFQDLLDSNGTVSRECTNEDTDAGIAYAKIKAVYPRKNKEDIANCTIDKLLQEVSHILGTTRNIKETNSMTFYKRLQAFVDSKEKSTGLKGKGKDKDKPKKKEKREMEFWPLIRVVRINVKSPALATGAVIVDLPGVHDANAARAAVAEGYMKQCTGLWIVAPINRAVDDKAAKSLLGESFKRQLKLDGGFSSVTFICSKTDDISLTEAQDSLGLDDEIAPAYEELADLKKNQKAAKTELEELKDSKSMYEEIVTDADEQIEIWEGLSSQLDDDKTVYAPKPKSAAKKRKSSGDSKSRKRRRTNASDTEDTEDGDFKDKDSDDSDNSDEDTDADDAQNDPLTEEQISAKLQELKSTKKEARNQKNEVLSKMDDVRKVIKEAKRAEDKIESNLSAMCISGRNQYSKGAIQQDFAAGIRELDQEIAAEEDEENFNPDKDVRDYDEVAHSLPVFCVSSRGYQKLCGRLEKDADVTGFTTKEQTEIPLLQAHCEKLTETGRSANCRTFLNKLSQLLNSMTIWASSDGTGANMTAEQRAREARYLQKGLSGLESGLDKAVQDAAKELQDEFEDNIYDKYEAAVSAANNESINTALHWGLKVNREDRAAGGVHYATYKAICRRQGVFTNAQGPHEWNAQLAEPMIKTIAAGWEKTFSRRIPVVSTAFARNAANRLKTFHRDIEARARKVGAGIAGLSMLSQQVSAYESIFKDLSSTIKETIVAQQKEINREFVPVIAQHMEFAYDGCTNEAGPGSYARMKALMNGHIANERHTMFQASADRVKISLDQLVKTVEEQLGDKTEEVFVSMRRDYRAVLGAGDVKEGEMLPRPQRLCRKEIKSIISGIQKIFEKVVNGELDEDEAQLGEEDAVSTKQEEEDKDIDENATETDVEGPAAEASRVKSEDAEKRTGETEHKDEDAVMSDVPAAEQPEAEDEKGEKAAGANELVIDTKAASDSSFDGEDDNASDGSTANDSPSNQLSQDSPGQSDSSAED